MRARSALPLLAAATLIAAAWLSPRAVPYNMDEFVHYQALACATLPQERGLPSFRDGCGLYDLRLPFTQAPLPLRSYLYLGSVPAVPFYPFWRAIGDPVAVRVQGAVFALVALVLASRLLAVRPSAVALAGLVFPLLLVTFVVDEGPVGISAVVFLGALVVLRHAMRAETAATRALRARAASCSSWRLWAKLVFAWWLPAVAYFAVSVAWPRGERLSAAARRGRLPHSPRRRSRVSCPPQCSSRASTATAGSTSTRPSTTVVSSLAPRASRTRPRRAVDVRGGRRARGPTQPRCSRRRRSAPSPPSSPWGSSRPACVDRDGARWRPGPLSPR